MTYFLVWLIGTSLMNAFSYLFYFVTKKESREPYLLSHIILDRFPGWSTHYNVNAVFGWMLHYLLGIGFLLLNLLLIRLFNVEPSPIWGLPFGVIAGIIGIIGWRILFKIPDRLPTINFTIYYLQLVVAHIVFCVSAIAVYDYMG